ncbi:glycosyltransferase family 39 protein [Streptomyces sp. NBC_01465]|uniref:glycosyltransferase family 39 protein n=1 Tax=Streptomyces sp. NBC_01465 TaxID=2903878 RepID=UPI002E32531E|nr:glycosyltransferase family 39 protein [Streptomyces sp. NBC_01465]
MLWTFTLGLWGLSRRGSVWRDEAATWQVAERSTPEIWHTMGNVDAVHGGYYLLMHGVFECFGAGVATLRMPSVVAMGVAAACVAGIGRRLGGQWAGLAGGMAFGLLPAVQFHLQEGRPYALVSAGIGISTLLLVTVLQGRGSTVRWVAYGVVVLMCGLLNWLSLMVLPAHLVTLLWARAGRRVWTHWVTVSVVAAAGVLPLVVFSRRQSHQVAWIPPLSWHMMIGPAILLMIGGIGALVDRPRAGRLSVAVVGLPLLAVPTLGLAGISLAHPLFLDRYVLFGLLGLALLIGRLISAAVEAVRFRNPRASPWVLPTVVVVAFVALLPQSLAERSPSSRVDDVRAIAADVRRLNEAGSAVLYIPAERRDTEALTPNAFSGLKDIALAESPEASGTLKGIEKNPSQIRGAVLAQRRILLVTDASLVRASVTAERDKTKLSLLEQYFSAVAETRVRGRKVTVYERFPPMGR